MKLITYLLSLSLIIGCSDRKESGEDKTIKPKTTNFIIAFGSCNNQNLTNNLWNEILKNEPNVWIWAGDNIYADTENMSLMKSEYNKQKNDSLYKNFNKKIEILGTWDDHDYGKNDAGVEFIKKDSAQQLFLDFFDVDTNDKRRQRKGIYYSKLFKIKDKSVKIILLDTRYFRTSLLKDSSGTKRYLPYTSKNATILGKDQWKWFEGQLNTSKADFNIVVSSIQFLSREHGWETWGNMPREVKKLENLIASSKAKGVIILSGDRHISELSMTKLSGLKYPLYDFTSSGLTHSYESFAGEPNVNRASNVIKDKSFGILKINFSSNSVTMEIRGKNNSLLENITQKY